MTSHENAFRCFGGINPNLFCPLQRVFICGIQCSHCDKKTSEIGHLRTEYHKHTFDVLKDTWSPYSVWPT